MQQKYKKDNKYCMILRFILKNFENECSYKKISAKVIVLDDISMISYKQND